MLLNTCSIHASNPWFFECVEYQLDLINMRSTIDSYARKHNYTDAMKQELKSKAIAYAATGIKLELNKAAENSDRHEAMLFIKKQAEIKAKIKAEKTLKHANIQAQIKIQRQVIATNINRIDSQDKAKQEERVK